ncbi:hypothetical protein LTR60_001680 [Cryomyces antarcticus]|nr:hypothetical protein LTR60_001680 [Cryomyces antarcticus]
MSSMRNAVQRRNHKERAQPLERAKYGILEKHKDYSLRARDHNEKRKRLRILRQKAQDRNPDEFHFAMMSSATNNGRKITDRGNKALSNDVVRLLKTQDAGYLRTIAQRVRKERERLEEEVMLVDEIGEEDKEMEDNAKAGKHTIFVDTKEEQNVFRAPAKPLRRPRRQSVLGSGIDHGASTDPVPPTTPPQRTVEAEVLAQKAERALRQRHRKEQESRRKRLGALRSQEQDLMAAEQELENQRAKMSNSAGGVNKNGVKFKIRERKR